ncbi:MAG: hypothetical protein ACI4QM_01575 [Alphaproteobacteria bacterium]
MDFFKDGNDCKTIKTDIWEKGRTKWLFCGGLHHAFDDYLFFRSTERVTEKKQKPKRVM